jgi:hypothetical protein
LNIGLTPQKGSLTVHVQNAITGAAISGATVLYPPMQANFGVTDGSGNFTFPNMSPGTYTVTASAGNYFTNSKTVTVGTGTANLTIPLQPTDMGLVPITIMASPFNAGKVCCGGNCTWTQRTDYYLLGSYQTFQVEDTEPGYSFDHWTYGGQANPTTVKIVSAGTITAYFKRTGI